MLSIILDGLGPHALLAAAASQSMVLPDDAITVVSSRAEFLDEVMAGRSDVGICGPLDFFAATYSGAPLLSVGILLQETAVFHALTPQAAESSDHQRWRVAAANASELTSRAVALSAIRLVDPEVSDDKLDWQLAEDAEALSRMAGNREVDLVVCMDPVAGQIEQDHGWVRASNDTQGAAERGLVVFERRGTETASVARLIAELDRATSQAVDGWPDGELTDIASRIPGWSRGWDLAGVQQTVSSPPSPIALDWGVLSQQEEEAIDLGLVPSYYSVVDYLDGSPLYQNHHGLLKS